MHALSKKGLVCEGRELNTPMLTQKVKNSLKIGRGMKLLDKWGSPIHKGEIGDYTLCGILITR